MSPDEKSNVGDVVTMDCDAGFESQGPTNRTCTPDGQWSGNQTTCSSKQINLYLIIQAGKKGTVYTR